MLGRAVVREPEAGAVGKRRLRVAIDLTALTDRDRMQVRFVRGLVRVATDVEFVVLMRRDGARGLGQLEGANVRCVTVAEPGLLEALITRSAARVAGRLRRSRFGSKLGWLSNLGDAVPRLRPGVSARSGADVVFCPFTSSRIRDPGVPLVVAVHDLQHLSHPYLLEPTERAARAQELDPTCRRAEWIVCSTSSLCGVARMGYGLPAERVVSVAPGRLVAEPVGAQPNGAAALARYGLRENGFYLMRGDFEARQNHTVVLTALGMVRARHPECDVHLVCAGRLDGREKNLRMAVERMGLGAAVHFPGALAAEDLAALMNGCRAVLVPSLYETIGEVVLQAMALGRPVLCSDVPGLAELVGDAALKFDPHRPAELAAAFERIQEEPAILHQLGQRGRAQFETLDDAERVAQAFEKILREAA